MIHTDIDNTFEYIKDLKPGERTIKELPYGGYLFLEHDIPFLMVYRQVADDNTTIRLARTGASYLIIGEKHYDYFENFLKELTKKMSAKFGSFIIMEIYNGEEDSNEFIIKGPSHKLPVSLEVLRDNLSSIPGRKYWTTLSARIEKTKKRTLKDNPSLFSIDEIKEFGGTLIGLEVPPVYRDEDKNVFPVYFRYFRDKFAQGVQKAVFEFIRVQTSSELKSYYSLGIHQIEKKVFQMDKMLTEIESSYQFLLLVAPVNIQTLRQQFFESDFQKINEYHYRLLPIDPDILKRKLYNLPIEEIDDPALSFLFNEKREEIDKELTMLKERGSRNFFYSSIQLYKELKNNVLLEAKSILENISEDKKQENSLEMKAADFGLLAQKEFDFFREQDPLYSGKIHIRKDVNVMMVSNGELYIPSDYTMTKREAKALIQHEIGTHSLTYFNGNQQPLSQLAVGFADYDPLQEGIAVLSEYLIGGLSGNRLRTLAGRVIAGSALLDGCNFKEMFDLLHNTHGFSKEPAFNITSRMFQGGGFLKDIIYLRGLVELREYLKEGGNLEFLLTGKFALKHVPMIKDLTDRRLLNPPKIKPRYFQNEDFEERLNIFKQSMPLSKLI